MGFCLAPGIDTLPSLPSILNQLLQTLDDSHSSARDIESIVERDPSTTSKLLAVANSSYYGLRHQVTTLQRAVVVLGFNEVRNICLGTVLTSMLNPKKFKDPQSAQDLWRHCLAVQETARILADGTGLARPDVAMIAGLLHDLGWVVILGYRSEEWENIRKMVLGESLPLLEAEKRQGISHQEAGEALGKYWDLPPMIVEVMRNHHSPGPRLAYYNQTGLIYLANVLASEVGMGFCDLDCPLSLDPAVPESLGISDQRLTDFRDKLESQLPELEALLQTLLQLDD